jgi:hypothetical protein
MTQPSSFSVKEKESGKPLLTAKVHIILPACLKFKNYIQQLVQNLAA